MASHDLREREKRCEMIAKYVQDGAGNDAKLERDTEDIRRVLEEEKDLRRNCESTLTRLSENTERLSRGLRDLQDDSGKVDMEMLSRKAKSLEQAKFDNLVALILGRDGSLDRLRSMSQAHRDSLLNAEKDQLEQTLRDDIVRLHIALNDNKAQASEVGKQLGELQKSMRDQHSMIRGLEDANGELQSHISGLEKSMDMTRDTNDAKLRSSEQSRAQAENTVAKLEREVSRLKEDVVSKDTTVANLDVSQLRKVQSGLASFFASLASPAVSGEDLRTWTSYIGELQSAGWVQALPSEPPWTMLPLQTRDLQPDPTVTPTGLIELLTRLYGVPLQDGNALPIQLLHLLTRQIATANMLPAGGILAVLGRLVSALESTPMERDRTLQLLVFGLVQAIRCTWGRLNQHDDTLSALFPRVEALVNRSGASILRLVELVKDDGGAALVRDLLATRDKQGDPVHRNLSFDVMFSPETKLGLIKLLPDWRAFVWILHVDDRTIRPVLCELGEWEGSANLYRISTPGNQNDVVLDCHHITDKSWLLRNMRQRELESQP
ncbi:hypothetical protein F4820DRAFT_155016 [Hypoxylon rubiginosum]|uniref:Uncharacterized protein n=1 Tax=Hypoxylon rubiginosum TaxID=110542 RepID=A0ACB9Z952_9PEZI|nr:hypothetical protein F4820DRAFT_155016 [Hypoxylon rubiginosum]